MLRPLLFILALGLAGCATTATSPTGKRAVFAQVEQQALATPLLKRMDFIDGKYKAGIITLEEALFLTEPLAETMAVLREKTKKGAITLEDIQATDLAITQKYSNRPAPVNEERYNPADYYRADEPVRRRHTPSLEDEPPPTNYAARYATVPSGNWPTNFFNPNITGNRTVSREPAYNPGPMPRAKIQEVNPSNTFLTKDYRGRTTEVTPIQGGYKTRTADGYRTVVKDSGLGYSVQRDNQGFTRQISGSPFRATTSPSGGTSYSPSGGGYKPY